MQAKRVAIPHVIPYPRAFPRGAEIRRCAGVAMGTSWSASFVARDVSTSDAARAVEGALAAVVAEMSPWEKASDISRYNNAASNEWVALPSAMMSVLGAAVKIANESGGAYDPACGALVDLWGFGPAGGRQSPPSAEMIEGARAHDWLSLCIDREHAFQPGGLRLDFSSIAKGYGVDAAGEALTALGLDCWLVDIGGELKGAGTKPDGSPWWVSLEPETGAPFVVALSGRAAATSGDEVRYFDHDGRKYSHTIDPRTGYPVEHNLSAVTVVHESAMLADAYATAILVLGPDEGFAFAEERGLPARLAVGEEGGLRERITRAMQAMLD